MNQETSNSVAKCQLFCQANLALSPDFLPIGTSSPG